MIIMVLLPNKSQEISKKRLVIFTKNSIENFVIFFGQTFRLKTVIDMTGDKYKP